MAEVLALAPGLFMAFGCFIMALHYWEEGQKEKSRE